MKILRYCGQTFLIGFLLNSVIHKAHFFNVTLLTISICSLIVTTLAYRHDSRN